MSLSPFFPCFFSEEAVIFSHLVVSFLFLRFLKVPTIISHIFLSLSMNCDFSDPKPSVSQQRLHINQLSMQSVKRCLTTVRSRDAVPSSQNQSARSKKFKQSLLSKFHCTDEAPNPLADSQPGSGMSPEFPECILPIASQASLDLFAWIDHTNSLTHQSRPGHPSIGREDAVDDIVPWMQLSQEGLFDGVSRANYRETPLYSEPGSPALSRAYGSDSQTRSKLRVSNVSCGTFGRCDTYAASDSSSCNGGASTDFSSGEESVSGEGVVSISTRKDSPLSIQCQGSHSLEITPMGTDQLLSPRFEENELPDLQTSFTFTDWAEAESSGRSSPCYSDYVYEVCNYIYFADLLEVTYK